jgi:hypothetical protein
VIDSISVLDASRLVNQVLSLFSTGTFCRPTISYHFRVGRSLRAFKSNSAAPIGLYRQRAQSLTSPGLTRYNPCGIKCLQTADTAGQRRRASRSPGFPPDCIGFFWRMSGNSPNPFLTDHRIFPIALLPSFCHN